MENYKEMVDYPFISERLYKVVRTDQLDRFFPECPSSGYRPSRTYFEAGRKEKEDGYELLKRYRRKGQYVSYLSILAWSSSQVWKMRNGAGQEAVYHASELEVVEENSDESDG